MGAHHIRDRLAEELLLEGIEESVGADPTEITDFAIEEFEEDLPEQYLFDADEQKKASQRILNHTMDGCKNISTFKAELKPVVLLAKNVGASPDFFKAVTDLHRLVETLEGRLVGLCNGQVVRPRTVKDLEECLSNLSATVAGLTDNAKVTTRNFSLGLNKVRVWDKKDPAKRETAPYEVRVAASNHSAQVWNVLKRALPVLGELSAEGVGWAQSLFKTLYEPCVGSCADMLRNTLNELDACIGD